MPEWLSKIMGNSISLEEELINLRLTSKQMQRASKKCDKNEKEAVKKLKKVSFIMNEVYNMHRLEAACIRYNIVLGLFFVLNIEPILACILV